MPNPSHPFVSRGREGSSSVTSRTTATASHSSPLEPWMVSSCTTSSSGGSVRGANSSACSAWSSQASRLLTDPDSSAARKPRISSTNARSCAEAIRDLYRDIGFPERFTPEQLPEARVREMATRAVPGLYAGIAARDFDPATANDHTVIACPSARKMTVAQAEAILRNCLD